MRLRRTGKRGNKVRSRNTRKRQTLRRRTLRRKKRQSRRKLRGGSNNKETEGSDLLSSQNNEKSPRKMNPFVRRKGRRISRPPLIRRMEALDPNQINDILPDKKPRKSRVLNTMRRFLPSSMPRKHENSGNEPLPRPSQESSEIKRNGPRREEAQKRHDMKRSLEYTQRAQQEAEEEEKRQRDVRAAKRAKMNKQQSTTNLPPLE